MYFLLSFLYLLLTYLLLQITAAKTQPTYSALEGIIIVFKNYKYERMAISV